MLVTKNNLTSVLQAIGGLSSDGIFLFSVGEQSLAYVNNSLLQIFDISHESFRHQPAFFIHHILEEDVPYLEREYKALIQNKKKENIEFRLKAHDGNLRYISCSCYLIENGKFIVGLLKDVTASREQENYIINYGAKKNTLLDMVTHNLSGPLAVSKNMIESLENVLQKQGNGNVAAHVQLIRENTRHCIDIVNEFLEEEHLVSEMVQVRRHRFDVIEKMNTIIERFRKGYPDFKFAVTCTVQKIFIINDSVKFLQVVNNLLSNAIKWSPSGSVIQTNIYEVHDALTIEVKDPGIGIPDDLKAVLFQRNTPASRPGLRGEKSIGMGLYIVRKLVNLMEGKLSFDSKENQGTTFRLQFPKEQLHPDA